MGGGREIPILTSTPAIAGTEATIANAKRIVHKSNFFILLPPYPVFGIIIRIATISCVDRKDLELYSSYCILQFVIDPSLWCTPTTVQPRSIEKTAKYYLYYAGFVNENAVIALAEDKGAATPPPPPPHASKLNVNIMQTKAKTIFFLKELPPFEH